MCVAHVKPASVWIGAPVSNHEAQAAGLRDKHAHGAIYGKRCRSEPPGYASGSLHRKAQISQSRVYTSPRHCALRKKSGSTGVFTCCRRQSHSDIVARDEVVADPRGLGALGELRQHPSAEGRVECPRETTWSVYIGQRHKLAATISTRVEASRAQAQVSCVQPVPPSPRAGPQAQGPCRPVLGQQWGLISTEKATPEALVALGAL